jgi:radical SAM superfamily enzyme YgiQ (UPF0313 family)
MKIVLINLNLVKVPAIAPYALDVLGSALDAAGHEVDILDLCAEDDPHIALHRYFAAHRPGLVGLSMRNAIDMYLPSLFDLAEKGSFIESHKRLVDVIKSYIDPGRILVGGVGFSVNPYPFLKRLGLRYGLQGPGEAALPQLASELEGKTLKELAGGAGTFVFDSRQRQLRTSIKRAYVNNRWYYDYGGQAAIRTSSGCAMRCSYCAEPSALGSVYRRAAIENSLSEIDQLVSIGVRDFQTADSEFNMPFAHSKDVLRAIIGKGYGKEVRFWAYCQPRPFDDEYAGLLAKAGVVGVNFGTDHTDEEVLSSLGKWYSRADIEQATLLCKNQGIAVMHELLLGSPGDTPEKMYRAIEDLQQLEPWVIGVTVGLAVFPNTPLGALLEERTRTGLDDRGFYFAGEPMVDPTFYVDPTFRIPEIFEELGESVGRGSRNIMLPAPSSTAGINNQLVNSERVRRQLLVEKLKGPSWYHFPGRAPGVDRSIGTENGGVVLSNTGAG